ncbi:Methylase of polypeptide chain release factors [Halapricum desulfuricans]|uniref:Methylase of polypeptide chain release factors n=1 Tax=Halapricum desulfuricans TaxID=2841257 RepID=A0A897NCP1_9EURY|nr:HemK2/MTQ2 family protein methyltransferase [Halapricum desulfuricans]QSG10467.1 Methylase of polypeptide chain release factors [Halapricum desulfuricans]
MNDDRPELARQRDLDQVYEPAEDSHLLAETAREYVTADDRVLEVGTGSGYVATALADTGAAVVATDINPMACREARDAGLAVVRANLVEPFRDGVFDVVAFNPPYLPTPPEQEFDDWMERALSGGEDGRAVVDPFLDTVRRVLAEDGVVLLLVSSLTDIEAVRERAAAGGLDAREVADESHPFERLVVLELRPDRR